MNNEHKDLDQLTKELLGKSLLKPVSHDFDDTLMDKIFLAQSPGRVKSNGNNTKKAWILLMVAVVFMFFLVVIAATISGRYFTEISNILKLTYIYMLFGGLALFVPVVFYQFDLLLQLMFGKQNRSFSMK